MAYVRQRGNQLAIVHGVRDPETKKVEQQILFTIYSSAPINGFTSTGRRSTAASRRTWRRFPELIARATAAGLKP